MNDLKIQGKQTFMGKEIPVVLGSFGSDKNASVTRQLLRFTK